MDTVEEVREKAWVRECLLGVVGDGFVIVAADASVGYIFFGPDTLEDKINLLHSHKLFAVIGVTGDRFQFVKLIHKKLALSQSPLTTVASAANFIRDQLATASLTGMRLDMLLAGYDKETGPSLYHIDCTASLKKVEKGAFGVFGSSYSLSTMDTRFHSGMSLEEAIDLVDACIEEIRVTLDVESKHYVIKVVDKDGAREYAWRKLVEDASAPSP